MVLRCVRSATLTTSRNGLKAFTCLHTKLSDVWQKFGEPAMEHSPEPPSHSPDFRRKVAHIHPSSSQDTFGMWVVFGICTPKQVQNMNLPNFSVVHLEFLERTMPNKFCPGSLRTFRAKIGISQKGSPERRRFRFLFCFLPVFRFFLVLFPFSSFFHFLPFLSVSFCYVLFPFFPFSFFHCQKRSGDKTPFPETQ